MCLVQQEDIEHGSVAPPTWNIGLQPASGPVIPASLRVSIVQLDHINIRLMGADGLTEAFEDQQGGSGRVLGQRCV